MTHSITKLRTMLSIHNLVMLGVIYVERHLLTPVLPSVVMLNVMVPICELMCMCVSGCGCMSVCECIPLNQVCLSYHLTFAIYKTLFAFCQNKLEPFV